MLFDPFLNNTSEVNQLFAQIRKSPPWEKCVYFKVQNVADYVFMENDKEFFYNKDFPCCLPPWEDCILGWRGTPYVYSKEVGKKESSSGAHISFYAICHRDINNMIPVDKPNMKFNRNIPISYTFTITVFLYNDLLNDFKPLGMFPIYLDGMSNIIKIVDAEKELTPIVVLEEKNPNWAVFNSSQKSAEFIETSVKTVVLMAFSLCNCKNIEVKKEYTPKEIIKRRARKNKIPFNSCYTLEINRAIPTHRETGGVTGIEQRHHLCRGHFKDFRTNPLFGKHEGVYWWENQWRGHKELGEIKKEYVVSLKNKY